MAVNVLKEMHQIQILIIKTNLNILKVINYIGYLIIHFSVIEWVALIIIKT